ncbi:MAG: penicillin-binding protein activator LpoB [Phycisphaerae bacterium]|nr:penicillin-binding protein activator LpoB [Phycisphaerae bacterium]
MNNTPCTRTRPYPLILLAGAALNLSACAPTREVTRVDPSAQTDVDYRFNDTDARVVYESMVNDTLYRKWIDRFQATNSRAPVVVVGPVRNDTQDYIDTKLFTTEFERELINSDRVRFVAMREQRGDVREERAQGQEWSRPETRKQMKYELGADFIILGRIGDNKERSLDGRTLVNFYQVNLEMVDLESNEKVWIGTSKIKKISRDR